MNLQQVIESIRTVPNFPKKGILFYDLTTAFKIPEVHNFMVNAIYEMYKGRGITKVVGIESRGFILGGALAQRLGAGFVPIRKPGRLPAKTVSKSYDLEYGSDIIEIHEDAIHKDDIVLLHDDLLATGGTAAAACEMLESMNPAKIYINFIVELDFLCGRDKLCKYNHQSLIHFDE